MAGSLYAQECLSCLALRDEYTLILHDVEESPRAAFQVARYQLSFYNVQLLSSFYKWLAVDSISQSYAYDAGSKEVDIPRILTDSASFSFVLEKWLRYRKRSMPLCIVPISLRIATETHKHTSTNSRRRNNGDTTCGQILRLGAKRGFRPRHLL
ncbi:hypothetical protein BDW72DRAFT_35558 [Aspergillus terricola var. indicus]